MASSSSDVLPTDASPETPRSRPFARFVSAMRGEWRQEIAPVSLICAVGLLVLLARWTVSLPWQARAGIGLSLVCAGTGLTAIVIRTLPLRGLAFIYVSAIALCVGSGLTSDAIALLEGNTVAHFWGPVVADVLLAGAWSLAALGVVLSVGESRGMRGRLHRELEQLAHEVQERQATQEALRQAEIRQNAMLGAIPDLVLLMHKNHCFTRYPIKKHQRPTQAESLSEMRRNSFRRWPFEEDGDLLRNVAYALERRGPQLFEYQTKMGRETLDLEVRVIPGKHEEALVILRDLTARRCLEREILEASAREQRRIARDLHDGLGQELTGMLCLARGLAKKLDSDDSPFAAGVDEITRMLKESIVKTRNLAKGLRPVALEAMGLQTALKELADTTQDLFGIACEFSYDSNVVISEDAVAEHLYRIAQEAVTNAVKHADPALITISLGMEGGRLVLAVEDDGVGLPAGSDRAKGLGLGIMKYRARIINGSLKIRPGTVGGTTVLCVWPSVRSEKDTESKDTDRP